MTDDDENYQFTLGYSNSFPVTRVIGGVVIPDKISIQCSFIPLIDTDTIDFKLAISKINYWIENFVTNSIMFNNGNEWALESFISEHVANVPFVLPGEPRDNILCSIFLNKFTALSNGQFHIYSISIQSTLSNVNVTLECEDGTHDLLPSPDTWLGDVRYFDQCWWDRNDASTLDVVPEDGEDLNELPMFAQSLDFLRAQFEDDDEKVILHPRFKPSIVIDNDSPEK